MTNKLNYICKMHTLIHGLLDLLFVPQCAGCHTKLVQGENFICTICWHAFPETDYHTCIDNPLTYRLIGKVEITYGWALYKLRKHSRLAHVLFAMKYKKQPSIGTILGQKYGKILYDHPMIATIDSIVPIPLHPKKLQKRGYNQSDFFAKGLSESLYLPIHTTCIERIRDTSPQINKKQKDRILNLQNAFQVTQPKLIAHQHLLLVDDVLTTGATLSACAEMLLAEGAKQVSIATIAIAEED